MSNKYRIVLVENTATKKYHFEVETLKPSKFFRRTWVWTTIKTGSITKEPLKFYMQVDAEKYIDSLREAEEKPTETRKVVEEYK